MDKSLFVEFVDSDSNIPILISVSSILFIKPVYETIFDNDVIIHGEQNRGSWNKKEVGIFIVLKSGYDFNSKKKYSEVIDLFRPSIANYSK